MGKRLGNWLVNAIPLLGPVVLAIWAAVAALLIALD